MLATSPQNLVCCDVAPGVANREVAATADAHAVANAAVRVADVAVRVANVAVRVAVRVAYTTACHAT